MAEVTECKNKVFHFFRKDNGDYHGEFRRYNDTGELVGNLYFVDGNVKYFLFETPMNEEDKMLAHLKYGAPWCRI